MTTTTSPPPPGPAATGALTTTDHRALAFLGRVNTCLRECLCTLARHGVALRRADPERARLLLDTVRPWPFYKGGQFLFDLMEWEDLMVDGDPPPLMPAERIVAAFTLPVQWIAAATAETPTAANLIPGQRTAAALDFPLRLLATTARTAFLGAAQDLTHLLTSPADKAAGQDSAQTTDQATDQDATDDVPEPDTLPESDGQDTLAGGELPPLEGGFYLYEDIVLGALDVLGPVLADHAPADTTPSAPPTETVTDPDGP